MMRVYDSGDVFELTDEKYLAYINLGAQGNAVNVADYGVYLFTVEFNATHADKYEFRAELDNLKLGS